MKKVYSIFASALVLLGSLQSCNKTYIKEIVPKEENTQQQETVLEDDDFSKLLQTIPGVSGVTVMAAPVTSPSEETKAADASASAYLKQYFFYFAQPVDHFNPAAGSFNQRVAIQLNGDLKNPVILHTQGYQMLMDGTFAWREDLRTILDANWIEVEFRYFGESQPEPMENLSFTYLYSAQAAADLHAVASTLKKYVFKDSQWIATGASKGGITSGLQAYYSDLNGWKDFDLYVPFCAPFLPGSKTSPLDPAMGKYILTQCGAGYKKGTPEAEAYENLQKILKYSVTNKELRDALLCQFHQQSSASYQTIKAQLNGATEDRMLAGFLDQYMETLIGRFSYTPFADWAPLVPDPDAPDETGGNPLLMTSIDQVVNFVFMDEKRFEEQVKLINQKNDEDTKAIHTEADMLVLRYNPEAALPYDVQSVRELGCVGMDYSWLPENDFLTAEVGYQVEEAATGRYRGMDYFEGQWDGGELMTSFLSWVATETTQKIIFVYGSNDPWTGGAIPDAAAEGNPNVVKVNSFGGIHDTAFLNRKVYTQEASDQIEAAVKKFLNK